MSQPRVYIVLEELAESENGYTGGIVGVHATQASAEASKKRHEQEARDGGQFVLGDEDNPDPDTWDIAITIEAWPVEGIDQWLATLNRSEVNR